MSFFGTPKTARRRAAGEYVDGIWQEGEYTEFTFVGTVQPSSGRELQSLPEGRRERAAYTVYTTTQLRSVESDTNPDEVLWQGAWHEVVRVEPWQGGIISHYRCMIQLRNDPSVENPPDEEAP